MNTTKQIHFVCGLPRAGSTLLTNILAQHPGIHTTPTSACHETLFVLRNNWNGWIEHKASKDLAQDKNLQRVLHATLHAYHDTDKPIVIDKGRGWTSLLEMAESALGRKAKVIVPVRNVAEILASFEKLWRKEAVRGQAPMDYFQSQSVAGRAHEYMKAGNTVGLALTRLQDAFQRGLGDRMLLVDFDDLTNSPGPVMDAVYDFLGMDAYEHDFDNVEQVTHEDDSVHGIKDLHTIRKDVRPIPHVATAILGSELCKQFAGLEFWRNTNTQ